MQSFGHDRANDYYRIVIIVTDFTTQRGPSEAMEKRQTTDQKMGQSITFQLSSLSQQCEASSNTNRVPKEIAYTHSEQDFPI